MLQTTQLQFSKQVFVSEVMATVRQAPAKVKDELVFSPKIIPGLVLWQPSGLPEYRGGRLAQAPLCAKNQGVAL